ncbi:hypothetical protein NJB18091_41020 [Mycobacterium marinum]|nr:hypothetical protein NJB18091_41020 [Mycobacterium marinum]GJO19106.1 hypothetical protein NJB1507_12070 [Mycobacterium marinum]GJO50811.1 hypothetical protein NJB1604_37710 [Mycobacterium marinum]
MGRPSREDAPPHIDGRPGSSRTSATHGVSRAGYPIALPTKQFYDQVSDPGVPVTAGPFDRLANQHGTKPAEQLLE